MLKSPRGEAVSPSIFDCACERKSMYTVRPVKSAQVSRQELSLLNEEAVRFGSDWQLQVDIVSARNVPLHICGAEKYPGEGQSPPIVVVSASVLRSDVLGSEEDEGPADGPPADFASETIVHTLRVSVGDENTGQPAATVLSPRHRQPLELARAQFRTRPVVAASALALGERFETREAERALEYIQGAWQARPRRPHAPGLPHRACCELFAPPRTAGRGLARHGS